MNPFNEQKLVQWIRTFDNVVGLKDKKVLYTTTTYNNIMGQELVEYLACHGYTHNMCRKVGCIAEKFSGEKDKEAFVQVICRNGTVLREAQYMWCLYARRFPASPVSHCKVWGWPIVGAHTTGIPL